ncbi:MULTISPECIES: type III secretion system stator protein SctL [unclassified Pseudomonas]|jgi:type III secretion protein L|uniref:Type III secretion protein n=1 Tax=Pseudomonas gorinensis TaxID=3240790 RepID=A0ACA7P0D4_9PSED|nr:MULTISPECIES: type III secretion system stator protein SctL [unclassified Pseudomonas]AHC33384.1 type III secretion protein [Pseudomonas sp. TKP]MBL1310899.1 type III secretion system stator protein SctL [Pseudomonas sp.]PMX04913.1 HrpE/YscL family type III secretion apparatus protein [Pseudomonas sp. MPBC4-3]PMX48519.1 HrpE/YscL family type III secretion apparatus protein [Pseudomonas sp. FW301-21B01]PMY02652.1 HrpE/YscL family type III secretion apparatus protein [Pseudomonas sp. MPR-R5A]
MFCAHTIELHTLTPNLPMALIPREMLADYAQARQLIEQAEAHAQALTCQAQAECEKILESAGHEFWQRANAQLHRWESERQAMYEKLEQVATSVINTAIRSFLEETLPAQRLTALLNKLLDAQLPPIKASLLCNPLDREPVEQWLSRHCGVPWTLRVESTLAAQSLVLETEDGGFHINWTDTLDNLVTPSPKANIK